MAAYSKFEKYSVEEFKGRVADYFKFVKKENEKRKSERLFVKPYTIPGLAEHLKVTTDFIVNYPEDGKYSDIIEFASTKCENFILDAIFSKSIDKAFGKYLLETYHGHGKKDKDKDNELEKKKKKLRSISDILDEEDD